jgi:endonuclease G
VFRLDDPEHRGVRVPLEYWKVVAFQRASGALAASAYLRTQRNLPGVRDLEFGAFRTFQVPLAEIERLSALRFGKLTGLDVMAVSRSLDAASARLIRGPDDLVLQ